MEIIMKLNGLKVNFLGDSITEGHGTSDVSRRYDSVLADLAEFDAVHNYGIGGTRIAYNNGASVWPVWDLYFCGRATKMAPDADLIVVFGGTNDYGHGNAPFGNADDTTPDTFRGAVNWLMNFLHTTYPASRIVFMTPMRREGDMIPSPLTGHALADYVDAVIEAGKHHGVPVLDLYRELPIDPNIPEMKSRYVPDGLHPNDEGHKLIAILLYKFLCGLD